MKEHRFEEILSCLQFSPDLDKDTQITEILAAVNENLIQAVTHGNIITLDESMIMFYHCNLVKGRKPWPISSKIKHMADAKWNIAIKLEKYEGKKVIQGKEHVVMYVATGTTNLGLRSDIHKTWRIVIADAWFKSIKTAIALKKCGLYSAMLVKTPIGNFQGRL